ncbi:KR domain-containing protein [Aspergillus crustosus]
MAALEKDISFTLVDLANLARHKLQRIARVSSRVHELVVVGTFLPPTPLNVFTVTKIEEAFRHYQARGRQNHRVVCTDRSAALGNLKAENVPPIRRVIQAALRLKDTLFENISHEDYLRVLAPKLDITYQLHKAFKQEDKPLNFLVILSSYAGLIGNIGQASYAGASTFQDAFARWRPSQGHPTRSLDLGPIQGAGYLHEHPEALEHLRRAGLDPVSLEHFLRSSAEIAGTESQSQTSLEELLAAALANRSTPTLTANIVTAISRCVAQLTGVAVEDIDPQQSISVLGGDSLVVVEFRNWLRKTIDPALGTGKDLGRVPLREIAALAAGFAKESTSTWTDRY